jgi:hypothetical protein
LITTATVRLSVADEPGTAVGAGAFVMFSVLSSGDAFAGGGVGVTAIVLVCFMRAAARGALADDGMGLAVEYRFDLSSKVHC